MKLNRLIMLALFMLLYSQLYAEQFGYVNVVDCMMLHPTMRYFDISSKRFDLKAFRGINIEERVEENKVKLRMQINKLKDQLEEFKNKKKELEETFLERSENLKGKMKKLDYSEPKKIKKFEQDLAILQSKYYSDINSIEQQEFPIERNIKTLENSSAYTGYSSEDETRHLFSVMLDDIYEATKELSKKKKLSFVFNSSSGISYIESGSNFSGLINNCFNEFFDVYKNKIKENGEEEAKIYVGGRISLWLDSKDTLFKYNTDSRLSGFVMVGGVSLTTDVLEYIYKKHKIDKTYSDFIKEYFQKIMVLDPSHKDF
jgi:Skp family chaperone for outer membrane proteins